MVKNSASAGQNMNKNPKDKNITKIRAMVIEGRENDIHRGFEVIVPEYGEKADLLENIGKEAIIAIAGSYKTLETDKIMARIDKETGKLLPSKMELYTIEESKKAVEKYKKQIEANKKTKAVDSMKEDR